MLEIRRGSVQAQEKNTINLRESDQELSMLHDVRDPLISKGLY